MMNKKLGYYTVGDIEFSSKIQACIYATTVNKEVSWNFNQEFFNSYDWTNEPELSLDQLYDLRAKQLRETYDYIIVSYSGGADSHNLLMSFIRQGLHVDEIIVNSLEKANNKFTDLNPENKKSNNASAEHYLQIIPRLKELENIIPKTKITVLDMTDQLFETWNNSFNGDWVLKKRESLHPLNVIRFNYLYSYNVRKKFDKDKKIAIILGIEKPRTFIYENNEFYIRFTDKAANVISITDHFEDYDNTTIEYFYWSPESLDIMCKQAHVIKKWLILNPNQQEFWFYKNVTIEIYKLYQERILRSLIYTTWNNDWYQADKAIKDWYSEFDEWFIKGYKGTIEHQNWKKGIDFVTDNAGKYVDFKGSLADGLKIFVKHYHLGKLYS